MLALVSFSVNTVLKSFLKNYINYAVICPSEKKSKKKQSHPKITLLFNFTYII